MPVLQASANFLSCCLSLLNQQTFSNIVSLEVVLPSDSRFNLKHSKILRNCRDTNGYCVLFLT